MAILHVSENEPGLRIVAINWGLFPISSIDNFVCDTSFMNVSHTS